MSEDSTTPDPERLARAKVSGIEIEQLGGVGTANVWNLRDGKATRLAIYWDRARARADLGLKE